MKLRQLREATIATLGHSVVRTEKVDVRPSGESPIVLFGLMFCCAIAAGYVSTRIVQPINYLLMAVMAIGGVSVAFLAFAIPAQTILFLRKLWLRSSVALKRGRLRALLEHVYPSLRDAAEADRSPIVLGDLAAVEYLRGGLESAERDLAEALEQDPDSPSLLNNLGAVLADERKFDRSAELFAQATGESDLKEAHDNLALVAPFLTDPAPLSQLALGKPSADQAMALNNVGVFHMKNGDSEQAREWFGRAVRLNPRHAPAWANLGLMAYQAGRIREAAMNHVKAARFAPADARILNNLAVVLAAAGKHQWSRRQLATAQALEPSNIGIRINMLAVQATEGHVEQAMRGTRSLTAAPYHRGDSFYNLAVMQLASGDLEGAAESAASAIAESYGRADAFTNLAIALWQLGRRSEAVSHFRSAAMAPEAGAPAYSNLGRALLLTGDHQDALKVLEAGRAKWRGDAQLALDTATASLADAVRHYQLNMKPGDRRDFFANLHRSYSGLEGATRNLKNAAPEAHVNLGLYFYLREEFSKAAEHFELAIKGYPKSPQLRYLAGTAYGRGADSHRDVLEDGTRILTNDGVQLARQALPYLAEACEDRDSSPDTFYNAARVLYALDENERALEYVRKGIRLEDSEAMQTLGALCAGRQARKWLDEVRTQSLMSDGKKESLTTRARQFMDLALQYFRAALLHNELNPALHGNVGLAYMLRNRENDVEAALRHWQRMRAIAGAAGSRQYTAFTQVQSAEHAARLQFDDSDISCRDIDVPNWVTTVAPQPMGLRYVLEPVSEQQDWRLVVTDNRLKQALQLRDRIAAGEAALARLEA